MPADTFTVVRGESFDPQQLLDVLTAGYGRSFTRTWFDWKHMSSPWGRSTSWVAVDDAGPVGVAFALPWKLHLGAETVDAVRLVDGATVPRSLQRGIFRAMVAAALDGCRIDGRRIPVMATATPPARDAHVKNGAAAVDPIASVLAPTAYSRARTESDDRLVGDYLGSRERAMVDTAWDAASLAWRIDERSGHDYSVSRLVQASGNHGVVHRIDVTRGIRTLVVTSTWGDPRECRTVVRSVARRSRAVAVRHPAGPGARAVTPTVAVRRGTSLLCVWDLVDGVAVHGREATGPIPRPDLGDRSTWALDGLDLEGVI